MASLVVPVTFFGPKGDVTVKTLIDTGAEMSLVSGEVANKIGIPVVGEVSVRGAGRAVVKVARLKGIALPGARGCKIGPSMVWVFGKGAVFPGTGISAILGYDFMQKAKMQIAVFTKAGAIKCAANRLRRGRRGRR